MRTMIGMKAMVLALTIGAMGCGGAVGAGVEDAGGGGEPSMAPSAPAAAHVCVVDGEAFPACDGQVHDYAVMLHESHGSAIFCPSASATTSPACAVGTACTVATKTAVLQGSCR